VQPLLKGIRGSKEDDIEEEIGGHLRDPGTGAPKKISENHIHKDTKRYKKKYNTRYCSA